MKLRSTFLLGMLFLCFSPSILLADVSSRDNAGSEQSRLERDKIFKEQEKSAEAQKTPEIKMTEKEEPPAAPSGETFVIKEVKFLGNLSIPSKELEPFVQDLIGRPITLSEIDAAVSKIKEHYRSKGFVAVYAFVPAQQILTGTLKIDIMEGRVGEVKITGERRWFGQDMLKKMFRMKPGEILTYNGLRRDLAVLGKNRDLEPKAVLEPGSQPGTTNAVVEVKEKFPFHISGDINNSGSKNTGLERYGLTAEHTNVTGHMDDLTTTVQYGRDSLALGAAYAVPVIPQWGTTLGYSFSYTDIDVKGPFAPLLVSGDAMSHSVDIFQPIMETEDWNITWKFGFDSKSIQNYLLGLPSTRDELRILNTGLNFEESDEKGKTFSSHEFAYGIPNFLGSSDKVEIEASRLGTGAQFFVYRGSLTRFQKISDDILVTLRTSVQSSKDALPPSEQISIGGSKTVRGYQEGEYLGDTGGYLAMDAYFPLYFLPEAWQLPGASESVRKQFQAVVFADYGYAELVSPLAGEKKNRDLAGVGVGLRAHLYDKFYGRVEYAFPVGDRALDNRNGAFYFTVSCEFF